MEIVKFGILRRTIFEDLKYFNVLKACESEEISEENSRGVLICVSCMIDFAYFL